MICDAIGIAQYLFEIQDSGLVLCTVSKFIAFSSRFAIENVGKQNLNEFSNTNIFEYKGIE